MGGKPMAPTIAARIGKRVALARAMNGWTQGELAHKVGVTIPLISLIESGKRVPSFGIAIKLSDTLLFSLDYLAGRKP